MDRAKIRAARINAKTKRRYPLLASEMQTTPAEQAVVLEQLERSYESHVEKQRLLNIDFLNRAERYKSALAGIIGADAVEKMAEERQKIAARFTALSRPEYVADFWHCQLRKAAQPVHQPDRVNAPDAGKNGNTQGALFSE